MNEVKKKRTPKSMTAEAITTQLLNQPLENQIAIHGVLKKAIEERKAKLQEQIELITTNLK